MASAGEEIPVGARIISICDAFDAMRSARPYSGPRDQGSALAEIRRGAGNQFDPRMVDVFCRVVDQVARGPGPVARPGAAVRCPLSCSRRPHASLRHEFTPATILGRP